MNILHYTDKFAIESLSRDPDYEYVHKKLKKIGVTLKLLWQKYCDSINTINEISMEYTRFFEGYGD